MIGAAGFESRSRRGGVRHFCEKSGAISELSLAGTEALLAAVKLIIRILALALFMGAIVFWLATGANRGWTKTRVPKTVADEVTGIEGIVYEKRFVPGVDFLAACTATTAVLMGGSFLFRHK